MFMYLLMMKWCQVLYRHCQKIRAECFFFLLRANFTLSRIMHLEIVLLLPDPGSGGCN